MKIAILGSTGLFTDTDRFTEMDRKGASGRNCLGTTKTVVIIWKQNAQSIYG